MLYSIRRYFQIIGAVLHFTFLVQYEKRLRRSPQNSNELEASSLPVKLRLKLEKLGGIFVKFGQIMAMRPDIVPQEYITELSRLLDDAPTFDPQIAIAIIEKELGRKINEIYALFESKPIASASFAQVHKAQLHTGEVVVVKVQRPALKSSINTDIKFIRFLGRLIELSGLMRRVQIRPLIDDFIEWTSEELDYLVEASYAERMRHGSDMNPYEYIPKVYWDYTTSKIMTQEFLDGLWISDILDALERNDTDALSRMKAQGLDLHKVAYNIFHSGLHQAFEEEVFHGDPHAGNLVIMENNVIGYIDFGIIGQLSEHFRAVQLTILNSLEQGRLDRYARALLRLFNPPPVNVNVEAFQEEVKKNARRWLNNFYNPRAPLREHSSAFLLTNNLALARQYGLSFAQVAVRYYRALLVAELIVLRLNPAFNFRHEMRTYFVRYGFRAVLRERAPSRLVLTTLRARALLRSVPEILTDLYETTERELLTIRTAVSTFKLTLARLFKTLAVIGGGLMVLTPLLYYFYPEIYKRIIPFDWKLIVTVLIFLVPVWAWISRLLYIYSVQRGTYIRREG